MTTEVNGLLTYVDENGNQYILYPVTQIEAVDGLVDKLTVRTINITLSAAGWAASETAGFVQSIIVEGLTDQRKVKVYPAIPATLTDKLALVEETPKVKACSRDGNTMTFEAWEEAPVRDIPIVVEVCL